MYRNRNFDSFGQFWTVSQENSPEKNLQHSLNLPSFHTQALLTMSNTEHTFLSELLTDLQLATSKTSRKRPRSLLRDLDEEDSKKRPDFTPFAKKARLLILETNNNSCNNDGDDDGSGSEEDEELKLAVEDHKTRDNDSDCEMGDVMCILFFF